MTGIQTWTGDEPDCALNLKKRKVKKRGGGDGGGAVALDKRPNIVLADIKAGSVYIPVVSVLFSARARDRNRGLGYSD